MSLSGLESIFIISVVWEEIDSKIESNLHHNSTDEHFD